MTMTFQYQTLVWEIFFSFLKIETALATLGRLTWDTVSPMVLPAMHV